MASKDDRKNVFPFKCGNIVYTRGVKERGIHAARESSLDIVVGTYRVFVGDNKCTGAKCVIRIGAVTLREAWVGLDIDVGR